tara:strand:+ start:938 stop:1330 length:393 start_codon:yes stop_codon:yes gene_type:complete
MAAIIVLEFDYEINASLQVGDNIYHSSTTSLGGFDTVNVNTGAIITHVGTVHDIISKTIIHVYCDYVNVAGSIINGIIPPANSYISFSKNKVVNNEDLLGYYAEVEFENNEKKKTVELFSVNSEISENSK